MFGFHIFTSRKEKEILLIGIIKNLKIAELEKEMYTLSLEVLDDTNFESFFHTITSQISGDVFSKKQTIEPLTGNLI